jgi:starch-binding outer membrane protein, SusD/RagB family
MKKILSILIFVFALLGCSKDYLEKFPTKSVVIESFYKTPDDATQSITAMYNMLLQDDWWSYYIISESASDNCAGGAGSGDGGGFQRYDRGIQQPEANSNSEPWAVYFGALYRANIYLENEGNIDWKGKEELRTQYLAETHFLRAYFHFYLARMFGEIPALDHTLVPKEYLPRTPAEELYSFMIKDLKFCSENGLSQPYGSMLPENWGRANKWAAQALIARVYLYYSGYYNDETLGDMTAQNARAYIDSVVNYSNHGLVPEFASLWRVPTYSELCKVADTTNYSVFESKYAGEINPEVIWSLRVDQGGNPYSNWMARMIGPRNFNVDPYGNGWGANPVMPTLWNLYEAGDKRKTATILSWDDEGYTYGWAAAGQSQYTGYNMKKYEIAARGNNPEAGTSWQQNGFEDYMVIRYADVLLMAAELHLKTSDAGTAAQYVNLVRERAFGDDTHNLGSVSIDDIQKERRLELAGEGLRFGDILRSCNGDFSKIVPILTYIDDTDGGDYSDGADVVSLDVNGQLWADKKGLFQIPATELDLMGGIIEQNPGYVGQ